jgi:hypothetical protein
MANDKPRRRWLLWILLGVGTFSCFGVVAGAFLVVEGFGGPEVKTAADLPPARWAELLSTYSPVPVPSTATELRLEKQGFQDPLIELSFTLPQEDFDRYVAQLKPSPEGVYEQCWLGADGGSVADGCSVRVDPAKRRIFITVFWT